MTVSFAWRVEYQLARNFYRPDSIGRRQWICPQCQWTTPRPLRHRAQLATRAQSISDAAGAKNFHARKQDARAYDRKVPEPGRTPVDSQADENAYAAPAVRIRKHARHRDASALEPRSVERNYEVDALTEASRARLGRRWRSTDPYGISTALLAQDLDELVAATADASLDFEYLRNLPKTTWSEIFRQLLNECSSLGLHRVHRSYNPRHLKAAGFRFEDKQGRIIGALSALTTTRRRAHVPFETADYRGVLELLGTLGAERTARTIWSDMKREGIVPDRSCYNSFMQAILFDEDGRLQLTHKGKDTMQRVRPKSPRFMVFVEGKSAEISSLLAEMARNGIRGNTETFCYLIAALARDGEYEAVKDVLVRAWGIDTDELMQAGTIDRERLKHTGTGPLAPNSKLLVTIAEALGYMGEISAALRVTDFISQTYNIPMKANVWYQLMRWSWMYGRVKTRPDIFKEYGSSLELVPQIYTAMTSGPNPVEPTMDMIHFMISTSTSKQEAVSRAFGLERVNGLMETAFRHYLWASKLHRRNQLRLESARRFGQHDRIPALERTEQASFTTRKLYGNSLRRWVAKIVKQRDSLKWDAGSEAAQRFRDWQLRGLPDFLGRWRLFARPTVEYLVPSGAVSLRLQTEHTLHNFSRVAHRARRRRDAMRSGDGSGRPLAVTTESSEPTATTRGPLAEAAVQILA